MTELADATGLIAAVGGSAVLVTGLVQALKALAFPAAWQTGRAPMVAAAILSALAVVAGFVQIGLSLADPNAWTAAVAAWLTVYTASVGVHQTVAKVSRVAAGTTNRAGPDDASG